VSSSKTYDEEDMSEIKLYLSRFYIGCAATFLLLGCHAKKTDNSVKTAYYHHYGVEIGGEQDWIDRGGNGEVVRKLNNGVVVREQFRNCMLHGATTVTFPHSDIINRTLQYDKGVLLSEVTNFVSGMPQEKKQFLNNGCVLVTLWYEDGTPRAKEEYRDTLLVSGEYFNHEGHSESRINDGIGIRIVRDGLGNLVAQETVTQGELILAELYHPSGSPKERIPYSHGKVDGIKKIFLAGGEPVRFEEWKQGVLDGVVQIFENGEKCAEVPYVQGKRNGTELRYKSGTGVVVEEIAWSYDKRHGASVVILDNEPITTWYYEGKKVSKPQYMEMISHSSF